MTNNLIYALESSTVEADVVFVQTNCFARRNKRKYGKKISKISTHEGRLDLPHRLQKLTKMTHRWSSLQISMVF